MKKLLILLFLLPQLAFGQRIVREPSVKSGTTFAIIIDDRSYGEATAEVDAYKDVVERDGLGTWVIADQWSSPEQVKEIIEDLYRRKQPLEGVVLVGDIPIPMIRDAQYLSSAFKMDQKRDWKRSSIPSDRYYDDFDLHFNFIRRDEQKPLYFYYSIGPLSAHHLSSDIYSARIKPPVREGVDSYQLLRDYLRKVVRERQNENTLDNLFVFRGHGYNSEAQEAWSGEQLALREQLPRLFTSGNTIRFYDFETRWPMKNYLLEKLQDPRVDVALLHHHGGPRAQYINGYQNVSEVRRSIDNVKRYLRSKTVDKKDAQARIESYRKDLDVPLSWFDLSDSTKVADSLYNVELDINIEDLYGRSSGARFIMLDACFNGSFHLDEYQAGEYLFSPGSTIAVQGNTVNAIQDKWPDEYIGLLDHGIRVGQWHRHVNYLETHLMGDPTYRFANRRDPKIDINTNLALGSRDVKLWLRRLRSESPDVQAMALRKLVDNDYKDAQELLLTYFSDSPFGVVRLECLKLAARRNPDLLDVMIPVAVNDPYELTRRFAVNYASSYGSPTVIPAFVSSLTDDNLSSRVGYYARNDLRLFDPELMAAEIRKQYSEKYYLYQNDELAERYAQSVIRTGELRARNLATLLDPNAPPKERAYEVNILRNYHYHYLVPQYIAFAMDTTQDVTLRRDMIEALGWFRLSYQRRAIIDMCNLLTEYDTDRQIIEEAMKTRGRLSPY